MAILPDLDAYGIWKVLSWAVRLSIYNYVCLNIRGEYNVWAETLGRWIASPIVRRLCAIATLPLSSSDEFVWPTRDKMAKLQQENADDRPVTLKNIDEFWKTPSLAIWVPDKATYMQIRFEIIAHTGAAWHRGREETAKTLRPEFCWDNHPADIDTFTRACIH